MNVKDEKMFRFMNSKEKLLDKNDFVAEKASTKYHTVFLIKCLDKADNENKEFK